MTSSDSARPKREALERYELKPRSAPGTRSWSKHSASTSCARAPGCTLRVGRSTGVRGRCCTNSPRLFGAVPRERSPFPFARRTPSLRWWRECRRAHAGYPALRPSCSPPLNVSWKSN